MNRTFFFSIVGLGVLSAAGMAGSRAQQASVVTCNSSPACAPVVLVTQPDGQRVVAKVVSLSACDPQSKGTGECKAFTFTTQGGLVSGSVSGSGVTTLEPVNGLSRAPHVLTLGVGSGTASALTSTTPPACEAGGEPAAAAPGQLYSASNLVLQHLFGSGDSDASTVAEVQMEPVVVELDGNDADSWRADLERALEEARDQLSVNQDDVRDAWQRATEEARAAQERAREAYDKAMETYREAMRTAQERSRESERMLVERRAQADRGARRPGHASPRASNEAQPDQDSTLESRIAALERAARGRGQTLDTNRSLEERVAQLEKLTAKGSAPLSGSWWRSPNALAPTTPLPKAFRLRSTKPIAPVAPVPSTPPAPPSAGAPPSWFEGSAPFMKLRRAEPAGPSTPAPGASDGEREQMARAMDDLKREAARLREELARMRAEVERLPRKDGTR